MKGLFPSYADRSNWDYKKIWGKATFVFDTNALLNLYRYRKTTRDKVLGVLEKLAEQLWIPHHVALEFARNRLTVMGQRRSELAAVRAVLKDSSASPTKLKEALSRAVHRHSSIDLDLFKSDLDKSVLTLQSQLAAIESDLGASNTIDPVLSRLEELFDGKVGVPPVSQDAIRDLYKAADQRFAGKLPPGYMDVKHKENLPDYRHNGLIYKPKYGDFLVWRQLLDHAKANKIDHVVFTTDDGKEDWWWEAGGRTIGPRLDLIEEAREYGIDVFLMHTSDRFLEYANQILDAQVAETAVNEVRDLAGQTINALLPLGFRSQLAVEAWLREELPDIERASDEWGRFFISASAGLTVRTVAFEEMFRHQPVVAVGRLTLEKKRLSLPDSDLALNTRIMFVIACEDEDTLTAILSQKEAGPFMRIGIRTVWGHLEGDRFVPAADSGYAPNF